MKYTVELTPTARSELESAFEYIRLRAPLNAARWLKNIYAAIDTLEIFPSRCGIAPETQHFEAELRHFLFKSHRIIFHVDEEKQIVRILYGRHGKMRAVGDPLSGQD